VASVSPATVTAGQFQTFTVSGACLPDTLALDLPGCAGMKTLSVSPTEATFECGVQTSGTMEGSVLDAPGGTVLKSVSVTASWGGPSCPPPQYLCDKTCEDFNSSSNACGKCFAPCGAGETCQAGQCKPSGVVYGIPGQSCAGGLDCGGVSCCQSTVIPGGSFLMGRSTNGTDAYSYGNSDEQPEHEVIVDSFALDTYEVTVGRFRKWVDVYDGNPPGQEGDGAHPLIPGSGWQATWASALPKDGADFKSKLKCSSKYQTWTDSPGANENKPINCVNWYEAFAFCLWDGGRLPTEAEWEYAAAGGNENRLYPWGSQAPDKTRASYDCFSGTSSCEAADLPVVGSTPAGQGKYGQQDLAGSLWEWTLDSYDESWYVQYASPGSCKNCANIPSSYYRVTRGGDFSDGSDALRAADRGYYVPVFRFHFLGVRCARTPLRMWDVDLHRLHTP
jgi:sulfatase modifying factor 1